jgi:antitoxin component of MazEF toxin-antitoxin module
MDRKLIRSGNGWCIYMNNTIIDLLGLNPETDLIKYTVENDKLIISKSNKKRIDK